MLTAEQINTIHQLHWSEHWSVRKIARPLHLGRRTISHYLARPARSAARRQRTSKLDPFKSTIAEWLEQDANVSAVVVAQRLRPLGYTGGLSILFLFSQFWGITRKGFSENFLSCFSELREIGTVWGLDKKFPILGIGTTGRLHCGKVPSRPKGS